MKNAIDIAYHILTKTGYVSTMKLQKLVFYTYAYHLVTYKEKLFNNRIEAWANGPVIPDLYQAHKGQFVIDSDGLNLIHSPEQLDENEHQSIEHVLNTIGQKTGEELSELTHSEAPWRDARGNCKPGDKCENEITADAILKFYSSTEVKENPVFA